MIELKENYSLRSNNTFALDEPCRFFTQVQSIDQLKEALDFAVSKELPLLILGGGSNILLTRPFSGLVVLIANKGKNIVQEDENQVIVDVSAGENWHEFVLDSLQNQWFGLENLSLIPGSVGAAPMQNIGAYGVEVGSCIDSVLWLDRVTLELNRTSALDCRFGYRESIFKQELKERAIIWSVRFRLSKIPKLKVDYGDIRQILDEKKIVNPTPKDVSEAVVFIRSSKLPNPSEIGNAGSFFKNPVVSKLTYSVIASQYPHVPHYPVDESNLKIPAAWLIETAGWKGKNFGNYGVHNRQALVLVNYGGAKGQEILALAQNIQNDVQEKFGVYLQQEVNLI